MSRNPICGMKAEVSQPSKTTQISRKPICGTKPESCQLSKNPTQMPSNPICDTKPERCQLSKNPTQISGDQVCDTKAESCQLFEKTTKWSRNPLRGTKAESSHLSKTTSVSKNPICDMKPEICQLSTTTTQMSRKPVCDTKPESCQLFENTTKKSRNPVCGMNIESCQLSKTINQKSRKSVHGMDQKCRQLPKIAKISRNPVCDIKPQLKQSHTFSSLQDVKYSKPPPKNSFEKERSNSSKNVSNIKTCALTTSKKTFDEKRKNERFNSAVLESKHTTNRGAQGCKNMAAKTLISSEPSSSKKTLVPSILNSAEKILVSSTSNDAEDIQVSSKLKDDEMLIPSNLNDSEKILVSSKLKDANNILVSSKLKNKDKENIFVSSILKDKKKLPFSSKLKDTERTLVSSKKDTEKKCDNSKVWAPSGDSNSDYLLKKDSCWRNMQRNRRLQQHQEPEYTRQMKARLMPKSHIQHQEPEYTRQMKARLMPKSHIQHQEPEYTRQMKARLMPKSHIQHKALVKGCESEAMDLEYKNNLPEWNNPSQMYQEKKNGRDDFECATTHLLNETLNETITVITEVFELSGSGQPARLKECEIVKTKATSRGMVVQPRDIVVHADKRPGNLSTSSDHGFHEDNCNNKSVNASSKSMSFSRNSNADDNDEESGALSHLVEILKADEMVGMAAVSTRCNKDSGIETEITKSMSGTELTEHLKMSQTVTKAQKESISIMVAAAEDTKKLASLEQEQIRRVNFNKTRGSTGQPAEGNIMISRQRDSNQVDENCMVPQKQKQLKLLEEKTFIREPLWNAAKLRKQKIEELKRLREEKKMKDNVTQPLKTSSEYEPEDNTDTRFQTKTVQKKQVAGMMYKEQPKKQKQSSQKQLEAEGDWKAGDRQEAKHVLHMEETHKVHDKLLEKTGSQQKAGENENKSEDNSAAYEQKFKEEMFRMKHAKEEKERERELLRIERDKELACEWAEQQRIEREKKEERDRKIKEELEKLKVMEKNRLQQKQMGQIQQQQQKPQPNKQIRQSKSLSQKLSNTAIKHSPADLSNKGKCLNSDENTPVRESSINSTPSDPDNYSLDDKLSDESTDDEESPKKKIPEWATGVALNTALIRQFLKPPDFEELFSVDRIEPPDLTLVFPGRRKFRYKYRTSSANWNSPPLKQH